MKFKCHHRFAFAFSLLACWGCAEGSSKYSTAQARTDLFAPAEDFVTEFVDEHFGTPTGTIKVWDELPLNSHKAVGTVASSTGEEIVLELSAVPIIIPADGDQVLGPTGALMTDGQQALLASWNPESSAAKLQVALTTPPASGERVIVGPGQTLVYGRKLYAEHCQHCHGVAGDGNGPTAQYMTPRPRDYRRGEFKFTTTKATSRAHRADLLRVLDDGIPGTYMPSFKLLRPVESQAIVEYVLFLAMRGEIDEKLSRQLGTDYSEQAVKEQAADLSVEEITASFQKAKEANEIEEEFRSNVLEPLINAWTESQNPESIIVPETNRIPSSPESIAIGRKLYLSADYNCTGCHGEAGYGNGSRTHEFKPPENAQIVGPGLYDNWGNPLKPRNLRAGIYRGGRRPIDLYARLEGGIKGGPMPSFGRDKMSSDQKWHLINYVLSMPFEEVVPGADKGSTPPTPAVPATASN